MKDNIKPILLIAIIIVSCQKELDIDDISGYKNKIVLNGLLYADSTGFINVGRSISIIGSNNSPIVLKDASISMSNDNNETFEFQYDSLGYYSLVGKKFYAGETYKITVSKGGFSTVSSSATIPSKTSIESIDTSFFYLREPDLENPYHYPPVKTLSVTMDLKSNTSEKEYYIVSLDLIDTIPYYFEPEYTTDPTYSDNLDIFKLKLPIYSSNNSLKLVKNGNLEEIFESVGYVGGTELYFEKPEGVTDYSITFNKYGISKYINKNNKTLTLSLLVISEEYYKHQLSLARASYAKEDLLADKVSIYTNIKNGLGVLAGANQTSKIIDFSEHLE